MEIMPLYGKVVLFLNSFLGTSPHFLTFNRKSTCGKYPLFHFWHFPDSQQYPNSGFIFRGTREDRRFSLPLVIVLKIVVEATPVISET